MSWISVEDDLPQPKRKEEMFACIFENKEGYRGVSAFYFLPKSNKFFATDDFVTITHWQPLPEPPKL